MSENNRRNAKKAEKKFAAIDVIFARGWQQIGIIRRIISLRMRMYKRKNVEFSAYRVIISYLVSMTCLPSQSMISYVVGDDRIMAFYRICEFGEITYYFDGASSANNDGAAWHLMFKILQRAYERAPTGRFLLGYRPEDSELPPGLHRSRASLRACDRPTSVVSFSWERGQDGSAKR